MKLNLCFHKIALLLAALSWCRVESFPSICCPTIDECFTKDLTFLFMPNPECPSGLNEVFYLLYTRDNIDDAKCMSLANVSTEAFRSKRTYLFVHGWTNSPRTNKLIEIKNELLKKDDANIILVDWEHLARNGNYPVSASNTRVLGAHMAKLIGKIKAAQNDSYVWCIGHSLGAHACGHAGQRVKLDRITGIDPAQPLFQDNLYPNIGVNPGTADFVDIIHTSDTMGIFYRLGHADFYPNGGRKQPACSSFDFSCHHNKGLDYFIESIDNHHFGAMSCTNIYFFKLTCVECSDCAKMGYGADPAKTGAFYLKTNDN